MAKIDMTGLTAAIPEAVQELKDLIKKDAFTFGDLMSTVSIVPDVDYAKKIGFLGKLAAIGMTSSGSCTLNTINATMPTTEKTWDPIQYDTRLALCKDDIANTIAMKVLKKGPEVFDMTNTDYMALFLEAVSEAMNEMYWRFIWFADKDAAGVDDSPAGYITAGVDLSLINPIDGLWKRARTIIASTPAQRVTIAANAQITTALQNSTFTKELALAAANSIYYDAPLQIQTKMLADGFEAKCTLAFFNKLIQNFQGFELESMRVDLEGGVSAGIKVNGIAFVPVPEWDEAIGVYENLGNSNRDPFRVVCYAKENALVGVPSLSTWGEFLADYSIETKKVYVDITDKIDALFLQDDMVMVAI